MVVSILGCGWYGKALAVQLLQKGIVVKGSATSVPKLDELRAVGILPYLIKFDGENELFDATFFDGDVLIISIPPRSRSQEGGSYLNKIKSIITAAVQRNVKKVIYISSTGVYSDGNQEVNELVMPQPDSESGAILLEAEKRFQNQAAFATTIIRFGGLVGPGRHPGRFFAGKTNIPNGLAPVNLIHQQDCIGITQAVIEKNAYGYLFNACSAHHPAKADFYCKMAMRANLPVPEFINELNKWKIVSSVNLNSILNYHFGVNNWDDADLF